MYMYIHIAVYIFNVYASYMHRYAINIMCCTPLYTVSMNTQHHASIKAMPYEVVFGIKPSSEPVSDLMVINERRGDSKLLTDSEDDSRSEHNEDDDFKDDCFDGDDYGGHVDEIKGNNDGAELNGNDDGDDGVDNDKLDDNDVVNELNEDDDDGLRE